MRIYQRTIENETEILCEACARGLSVTMIESDELPEDDTLLMCCDCEEPLYNDLTQAGKRELTRKIDRGEVQGWTTSQIDKLIAHYELEIRYCGQCNGRYDSDQSGGFCEPCDTSVCDECSGSGCIGCDHSLCSECSHSCAECSNAVCSECMVCCDDCDCIYCGTECQSEHTCRNRTRRRRSDSGYTFTSDTEDDSLF